MQNIKKIAMFLFLICITINLNLHSAAEIQSETDQNAAIVEKIQELLIAIANGDIESLNGLVNSGIDFEKIKPLLPYEASSILVHVIDNKENHSPEIVKQMVKILVDAGADVNQQDLMGYKAPLHVAISKGYKDIIEFLFAKGADVNSKARSNTALTWAVFYNAEPEIFELLFKHGINLDTFDEAIAWTNKHMSNSPEILGKKLEILEKAKKAEIARQEAIVKKRQIAISPIIEEHLPKVLTKIISEMATHEYADVPEAERKSN